jgi:hypothetical protein
LLSVAQTRSVAKDCHLLERGHAYRLPLVHAICVIYYKRGERCLKSSGFAISFAVLSTAKRGMDQR